MPSSRLLLGAGGIARSLRHRRLCRDSGGPALASAATPRSTRRGRRPSIFPVVGAAAAEGRRIRMHPRSMTKSPRGRRSRYNCVAQSPRLCSAVELAFVPDPQCSRSRHRVQNGCSLGRGGGRLSSSFGSARARVVDARRRSRRARRRRARFEVSTPIAAVASLAHPLSDVRSTRRSSRQRPTRPALAF